MNKEEFDKVNVFGLGSENVEFSKYFIGKSYLNFLDKTDSGISFYNVTFEPGCRNNWHIHHADNGGGQILLATRGVGWYQEEGKPAQKLVTGSVVEIPAGVKHWHGAAKNSKFTHIAIEVPSNGGTTEWLEKVSDEDYNKLK